MEYIETDVKKENKMNECRASGAQKITHMKCDVINTQYFLLCERL